MPRAPGQPLANSRGPVAPPPPPGSSRPSRPPGKGARPWVGPATRGCADRGIRLLATTVGTYAFLRTLRGDEFSFRPPALDDVKRATCDTKHAYTTLAKKVASRIAGPSPAGWPSSQPKVDAAALVLIFERLIFHKGRFGVEVLELSNWRSVIKRRVQRFAAGAVRELWEEAHQAVVRRAPQHAQPDQFSAATPLPGAASVARVARLAEQAVADGNLSRGLQRILSQLNPALDQSDPTVLQQYRDKTFADQPEDLDALKDWESEFKDQHGGTLEAAEFKLGTFVPAGQDQAVDTLEYVVGHLDKSAAGGVSGWTNRALREAPTSSFLRPCVELFFGAD